MPTNQRALRESILDLVPDDGMAIGNTRLRQLLEARLGQPVDDEAWQEARDTLLSDGSLVRGPGRGGTVRRLAVVAEPAARYEVVPPEPAPIDAPDSTRSFVLQSPAHLPAAPPTKRKSSKATPPPWTFAG